MFNLIIMELYFKNKITLIIKFQFLILTLIKT